MAESLLKRVKRRDGENLTDDNIKKVIELLEQEKPITKKEACETLNISYNTTRLGSIIDNFKVKKTKEAEFRARNRGKPPTEDEIRAVIEGSLSGETVTDIANRLYRPYYFVKNVLNTHSVPQRVVGGEYFHGVPLLPEATQKEDFEVGEKVFSARYQSLAVIKGFFIGKNGDKAYKIYLLDDNCQHYAYQPWWELASIEHLKQFGVTL